MRILIADDQSEVRWALRLVMQTKPELNLVGEVDNVGDLFGVAEAKQPNLILIDWELPGQLTHRLIAALHKLDSQPIVIALSSRLGARQAALAAGVDEFISKGNPPEQLLAILHALASGGKIGDVQMFTKQTDSTVQPDDETLVKDIRRALHRVERLKLLHTPIHIEVNDGVVSLGGVTATYAIKDDAIRATRNVPGVKAIEDHLLAEPDLEIGIAQALADDPRTHEAASGICVNATTDNVVLAGRVPDLATAQLAETIATTIPGVRTITNHLEINSNNEASK